MKPYTLVMFLLQRLSALTTYARNLHCTNFSFRDVTPYRRGLYFCDQRKNQAYFVGFMLYRVGRL
jgi:hypothetical protein